MKTVGFLGLWTDPSPKLEEAIRKRASSEATTWAPAPCETAKPVAERSPISKWNIIRCRGSCIRKSDGEIVLDWNDDPDAPKYEVKSSFNDTASESKARPSMTVLDVSYPDILVPPNTLAGDWLIMDGILPSLQLVVRKKLGGPYFWIVGRAYVHVHQMSRFGSEEFRVFLDTEDAAVSASLFWEWWESQQPTPERIRSYIGTGFCGSPGSSFAEKWTWSSEEFNPYNLLD